MYTAVKKFFALHHYLVLPGIGKFTIEDKPAYLDFVNRCITSSQNTITFNNEKQQPEKKFYDFIADELNTDEENARNAFTDFTTQLQDDLNKKNNIYLESIGTLTKQSSSVVLFQPEIMPAFFPEIVAERIIRKNAAHSVRVGEQEKTSEEMHTVLHQPKKVKAERWWIAAVLLAIPAIAVIAFYYLTHN